MSELREITYLSQLDNSMQPALICPAKGEKARPLAVCLHTWSYGLEGNHDDYLERCKALNWHFIFPHFRGPNWLPEACGSDLVVSDLECAVAYMKENFAVDDARVYLVGGSGGGHASLLMAGRRPELWAAISSWCPISDIAAWYEQTHAKNPGEYDEHILAACGGNPLTCPEAAAQAKHRSPLTWLDNAKGKVILDIGTGIHDGHTGSVPVSHAIRAFNRVADPQDRISDQDIAYMVETEKIPAHLAFQEEDPAYGPYKVLLRRTSGMARLTLFEGGHDLLPCPAFGFLNEQVRGADPVWYSGEIYNEKVKGLTK